MEHLTAGIDALLGQAVAVVPEDVIHDLKSLGQYLGTEEFRGAVQQHLRHNDADGLQVVGRDVAHHTVIIADTKELRVRDCPEASDGLILLVEHATMDLQ